MQFMKRSLHCRGERLTLLAREVRSAATLQLGVCAGKAMARLRENSNTREMLWREGKGREGKGREGKGREGKEGLQSQ